MSNFHLSPEGWDKLRNDEGSKFSYFSGISPAYSDLIIELKVLPIGRGIANARFSGIYRYERVSRDFTVNIYEHTTLEVVQLTSAPIFPGTMSIVKENLIHMIKQRYEVMPSIGPYAYAQVESDEVPTDLEWDL